MGELLLAFKGLPWSDFKHFRPWSTGTTFAATIYRIYSTYMHLFYSTHFTALVLQHLSMISSNISLDGMHWLGEKGADRKKFIRNYAIPDINRSGKQVQEDEEELEMCHPCSERYGKLIYVPKWKLWLHRFITHKGCTTCADCGCLLKSKFVAMNKCK